MVWCPCELLLIVGAVCTAGDSRAADGIRQRKRRASSTVLRTTRRGGAQRRVVLLYLRHDDGVPFARYRHQTRACIAPSCCSEGRGTIIGTKIPAAVGGIAAATRDRPRPSPSHTGRDGRNRPPGQDREAPPLLHRRRGADGVRRSSRDTSCSRWPDPDMECGPSTRRAKR